MAQPLDIVIDVSGGGQGLTINWKQVAEAGVKLAFIKAVEGSTFHDRAFQLNRKGAGDAGILTVPYDFLRPSADAAASADFFIKTAQLVRGMPFMLDWEGRAADTVTPQIAEEIGKRISDLTGRVPTGYWGMPGSTPATPTAAMQGWDRFVPRFPQKVAPNFTSLSASSVKKLPFKGALFVQYSASGSVAGIDGRVDRSVWLGTLEELIAWHAAGTRPVD